ncbi:MAG: hypothetical protein ABGW78_16880 [Pirellulales bacterium]
MTSSPRILVYGFGPYKQYRTNITETTLRTLTLPRNTVPHIFDVCFRRQMFINVFNAVQPKIIIGLGQHPRARKLRIERKTFQRGCPRQAGFTTLRLPQTSETTVAYNPGDYVCNYSMWLARAWCQSNDAESGFLHIPQNYSQDRLRHYIQNTCRWFQSEYELSQS